MDWIAAGSHLTLHGHSHSLTPQLSLLLPMLTAPTEALCWAKVGSCCSPLTFFPTSAAGCTLIELMANNGGRITEALCLQQVARPVLQAIAGLHALGIVHRHLKPEHIVCGGRGGGSSKLVDFTDAACVRQKHCLNSRVGELQYMAPEVLTKPCAEDVFHKVGRGWGAHPHRMEAHQSCSPSRALRTRSTMSVGNGRWDGIGDTDPTVFWCLPVTWGREPIRLAG